MGLGHTVTARAQDTLLDASCGSGLFSRSGKIDRCASSRTGLELTSVHQAANRLNAFGWQLTVDWQLRFNVAKVARPLPASSLHQLQARSGQRPVQAGLHRPASARSQFGCISTRSQHRPDVAKLAVTAKATTGCTRDRAAGVS